MKNDSIRVMRYVFAVALILFTLSCNRPQQNGNQNSQNQAANKPLRMIG
jgi:hypothetical protein